MTRYDQVFAESYRRVLGEGSYNPDFISEFYRIFFSKSQAVADKFANTDMNVQKTMLHDSLDILVEFYKSGIITKGLERLGKIHGKQQHDIPKDLYSLWLDSLVEALYQISPEFTKEEELAWRLVMAPGIAYIQFMYDQ